MKNLVQLLMTILHLFIIGYALYLTWHYANRNDVASMHALEAAGIWFVALTIKYGKWRW